GGTGGIEVLHALLGHARRQGRLALWRLGHRRRRLRERLGIVDGRVVHDQRLGGIGIRIVPIAEPVAHAVQAPHGRAEHHGRGMLAPHVAPVIAKASPAAVIPAAVVAVVIVGPVLPVLAAIARVVLPLVLALVAIILALIEGVGQVRGRVGEVGLAVLDVLLATPEVIAGLGADRAADGAGAEAGQEIGPAAAGPSAEAGPIADAGPIDIADALG